MQIESNKSHKTSPFAQVPLSKERQFIRVGGKNHLRGMLDVQDIFKKILEPLYGDQTKAIRQIEESVDRKCYLLYENTRPTGVLVYKTAPSDEYANHGVENSIEIKSLFVNHAAENSGRGLGSALIDKLKEKVSKLSSSPKSIHVTVSETKGESLAFFRKKGFEVVHEWNGRYKEGTKEYLLRCWNAIEATANRLQALQIEEPEEELSHVIHEAHYDDIHILKKLSDGTFISGSKDNSLRKWNRDGSLRCTVHDIEPSLAKEENWITAASVVNDAYWVSGDRKGKVVLWKTDGSRVREIIYKSPKDFHISLKYNQRRVSSLASGLDPSRPSIFIGLPTMFAEYNLIEGRTETSTKVHKNDWVYCIHPVSATKVFTAVGGALHSYARSNFGWKKEGVIVEEPERIPQRTGKPQRQFISSLISLTGSENHYGLAYFGGAVKVVDAESKRIVISWKEHTKRIWSLENIAPHIFASCGEDRTVKVWDSREKRSVRTIADHVGQVTTLLSLDEHTLLAGTCPEQSLTRNGSAQIRFYDLRKGK